MTSSPAEPFDLADSALRDRAVAAARGLAPFDKLLTGGKVADVATGRLREADVGIVGGLIASVHPGGAFTDAAQTIALDGAIIAPGLIDTHLHIESSMVTPRHYAQTVVPQGTTTICWDPHEFGNVMGLDGVRWAVEASRDLPLRVLVLAPSCVPSAPGLERGGARFESGEMAEMLSWPAIVGVAEVMDMRGVLERFPHMRDIVAAGLASGKLVCGHARGLAENDLRAFAAAGIESDHELTSGEDLLAKLEAGMTIELRGSHDHVLPGAVSVLNDLPLFPSLLTLCTDDILPDALSTKGGMIDLVRRLVRHGLDPLRALQAGTLNAAHRLGRRDLGLVAPGRRADLMVLSDLSAMRVLHVLANGALVGTNEQWAGGALPALAEPAENSMHLAPLSPEDFVLRAGIAEGEALLRTVKTPRTTQWSTRSVSIIDSAVQLPPDLTFHAIIHRHGLAPASPVLGVLEGWGEWRGAIATTVAHDSHNLNLFGRDPVDLAAAANALIACGGGMAVAEGGVVTALLPLAVAGLVSAEPTAEVGVQFTQLLAAASRIVDWTAGMPFRSIVGASLACNGGPHVTDIGITDGMTGEIFESSIISVTPGTKAA